jgi:hypothetical protein
MTTVLLTGWTPGIKTISLVQLIMLKCGTGLIKAKNQVDDLIGGTAQSFSFETEQKATEFKEEATALGAIVQ